MINKKVILASQSPRRQQLLKVVGIDYAIEVAGVEEDFPEDMNVRRIPVFLAAKKCNAVRERLGGDLPIIAADTVVVLGEEVINKPADAAEAKAMLQKLSGQKHTVITGVAIDTGEEMIQFSDDTDVYFKELTEQEINYYIENFQPFDKAGAYAIQEWIGMIGIERIEGDYFNVMGLPVRKVWAELMKLD